MNRFFDRPLGLRKRLITWAVWPCLLAACANPALRDAQQLREAGQHEAALSTLQAAHQAKPQEAAIKSAFVKQRDSTVAALIYQAESARSRGQMAEHLAILDRLDVAAPGHPRTLALREDLARAERISRLMDEAKAALGKNEPARAEAALRSVLTQNADHAEAKAMLANLEEQRAEHTRRQSTLVLATAKKPITLEFREAALRNVFEALARAANVNFVFDKDVRGDTKVTLFLRNTTVDEALRVILNTQQLGHRLLNDNTVLVYPNTAQKQRELLDTVTRSFYLINADPKQAQILIRTVAKTRDMYVDERLNLLVVRDTPEVMRLVERLIAGIDLPDPEVMLELEVMEVSSKKIDELGLNFPEVVNYGIPSGVAPLTSFSGLRWSTANPLAVATLRGSTDSTNLLANPKIRARNREKAKISLGEKLPVFSTTTTNSTAVSTAVSISYVDVGLKLELEPQVQLNNEVMIKVALEVTNVTSKVSGPEGSIAYQVGSRQASTSLRLRDGETQVLAGLISDDESKNAAGLPWIHELPVVGRLFGKTSDTHNKTEVVLLITPRIVRTLGQSALPTSAMPSGTEAQPGALPWVSSQGQVSSRVPSGVNRVLKKAPGAPAEAALEAATGGARVSGPETVTPGASFQVTVHNPGAQPLDSALIFDPSLLEATEDAGSTGRVAVQVAAQGSHVLTFKAKAGTAGRVAELRAEDGGAPWVVQLGAGSGAALAEPEGR